MPAFSLRRVRMSSSSRISLDRETRVSRSSRPLALIARAADGSVTGMGVLARPGDRVVRRGVAEAAVRDMLGVADRGLARFTGKRVARRRAGCARAVGHLYQGGADPLMVLQASSISAIRDPVELAPEAGPATRLPRQRARARP